MSAVNNTISSSLSIPSPFIAEIGTIIVSPPHSSAIKLFSANCPLTRSGLAVSLSILLIATTIFALAFLAKRIASRVCGLTPSSAATTIITTSVKVAPCCLRAAKASCPGVSSKVILRPLRSV